MLELNKLIYGEESQRFEVHSVEDNGTNVDLEIDATKNEIEDSINAVASLESFIGKAAAVKAELIQLRDSTENLTPEAVKQALAKMDTVTKTLDVSVPVESVENFDADYKKQLDLGIESISSVMNKAAAQIGKFVGEWGNKFANLFNDFDRWALKKVADFDKEYKNYVEARKGAKENKVILNDSDVLAVANMYARPIFLSKLGATDFGKKGLFNSLTQVMQDSKELPDVKMKGKDVLEPVFPNNSAYKHTGDFVYFVGCPFGFMSNSYKINKENFKFSKDMEYADGQTSFADPVKAFLKVGVKLEDLPGIVNVDSKQLDTFFKEMFDTFKNTKNDVKNFKKDNEKLAKTAEDLKKLIESAKDDEELNKENIDNSIALATRLTRLRFSIISSRHRDLTYAYTAIVAHMRKIASLTM